MEEKQKGALARFTTPYKESYHVKTWALMALIAGLMLLGMGITMLALSYLGEVEKISLTDGWVIAGLGAGFYIVSGFGMKSPKQIKKEMKKEEPKQ